MRALLRWLFSLLPALAGGIAAAQAPDGWPALPPVPRAVILATGSDFGYLFPKGCHRGAGGSAYREGLNTWLSGREPGVERVWVATGNLVPLPGTEEEATLDLAGMHALLARAGYAFAGLGVSELTSPGPAPLAARAVPVPLVATNIRVFETGAAPFPTSRVRTIAGVRILFLAIAPHLPDRAWGSASQGTLVNVPEAESVRAELAAQAGRYDRVVLVSAAHETDLAQVLETVPGIEVVLASSGVTAREDAVVVHGVPVLWLGGDGLFLGRVAFGADGTVVETRNIPIDETFPIDPTSGQPR